jgi:hypothetical protein
MRIPSEGGYGGASGGGAAAAGGGAGAGGIGSRGVEDQKKMLFFSRSRADLGLTLWVAAALVIVTIILFQIDDGNAHLVVYNRHMKEASCRVLDSELEREFVPHMGAPPDMDLPPKEVVSFPPIMSFIPPSPSPSPRLSVSPYSLPSF